MKNEDCRLNTKDWREKTEQWEGGKEKACYF